MSVHIITLFPNVFKEYFNTSIVGRAIKEKKIKIFFHNPIDFTNKGKRVDDKPYGGGPGMVLQAEPYLKAYTKAVGKKNIKTIFFSPFGKKFTQKKATEFLEEKEIILLCGHYEGIDDRVRKITKAESISVGDAVLTGGEIPAMAVVDAVSRLIPGVLGNCESVETKRVASRRVYTRPECIEIDGKKYKVPKVLISGHHKKIENWRSGNRKGGRVVKR